MLINGIDFLYVFFELTLFILLILILSKLVKSYVIPFIYSEIENIKKRSLELKEKRILLIQSKDSVNDKITNQRANFDKLTAKIEMWNKCLLDEQKKIVDENKRIIKYIAEKRVVQSDNLSLLNMQRSVIPKSIKQAYFSIKDLYSGEKCSLLTKELINKIKP